MASRFGELEAAICQEGLSSVREPTDGKIFVAFAGRGIIVNLTSRFWWVNKGDLDIHGCARRGLLLVPETVASSWALVLRELSDGGSIYASTINPRHSGGIIF